MKRFIIHLMVTTAVVVPLAGCGDSDPQNFRNDPVVVIPPPPPPPPAPPSGSTSLESQGAGFAALFRAAMDSEPLRDPTEGDIIPIDFTAEPVEITGT